MHFWKHWVNYSATLYKYFSSPIVGVLHLPSDVLGVGKHDLDHSPDVREEPHFVVVDLVVLLQHLLGPHIGSLAVFVIILQPAILTCLKIFDGNLIWRDCGQ